MLTTLATCASLFSANVMSQATSDDKSDSYVNQAAMSELDFEELARVRYSPDPTSSVGVVTLGLVQNESGTETQPESMAPAHRARSFGESGSWRFNVLGSYAVSIKSDAKMYHGAVSFSYFLADDFSVDFEFGLMSFDQKGPNAWGGNFVLLARWHFISNPGWTIYLDGGAGLLKTDDDVPHNGSNFNFTPQLGMGATLDIGAGVRLFGGIRWHHISNANISDENPGRDAIQVYAGLSFPF